LKKKVLVFRFSALGDVAMTIPVIWSFLQKYPEHEICFVSRPFVNDLVTVLPRVHFFPLDLKGRHKGFFGLFRLFRELKKEGPWNAVVDLHSVLRTHILTTLFKASGVKVSKIDKGREEKKRLTRKANKIFKPLLSTQERYIHTFGKAGFPFEQVPFPGKKLYGLIQATRNNLLDNETSKQSSSLWGDLGGPAIGIAPFAKHQWKMWPEDKMKDLIQKIDDLGYHMIFFGGKGKEQEKLEQWATELKNARTFAGQLTMGQELQLISQLDVMISMDSANMHLASLTETRVVSIWGATHPYAGFYGYSQSPNDAVQINLECRPCSVFGNKPCHRGDFACMMDISPQKVLKKVTNKLTL
jgi:ADP-heptose:LPS heptosyltransferase